jgi:hypothetical protein
MKEDASGYDIPSLSGHVVSKVAEHDRWFRAEVQAALIEANDPKTQWVSHEEAKAEWAQKRAKWLNGGRLD